VSKRCFTLIYGDAVHVAPGVKRLLACDFSALIDAESLKEKTESDAERYRIEVASDVEKEKELGFKAGFEQGYAEWLEQIVALEEERKQVQKKVEHLLVPVAMTAVKKIVGKELASSEDAVVFAIKAALKAVSQHKKIVIYVHPRELEVVTQNKKVLSEVFEKLESLSVRPLGDIEEGGCTIETEAGIINAKLENRWILLEEALSKILLPGALEREKETLS